MKWMIRMETKNEDGTTHIEYRPIVADSVMQALFQLSPVERVNITGAVCIER